MTAGFPVHIFAQGFAEHVLNGVAAGLAMALVADLLLRLAGKQNAGTRFAVWYGVLLAMAALPFITSSATGQAVGLGSRAQAEIRLPGSWALYLVEIWATGAMLGLMRIGVGLWRVRRLGARAQALSSAELDTLLTTGLADSCSQRAVTISVSGDVRVPTAIGFFRPTVLIPTWAMRTLSAVELQTIVLHELAHLRRWDDWTNLLEKSVRAVFFFHPAMWWAGTRLSLLREMACDDLVLAQTSNPRAYAECLVSLAEKSFLRRSLAMAHAAVNRMSETSQRVAEILDRNRPAGTRIWKPALGALAICSVAMVALLSRAPNLVAFEDPAAAPLARNAVIIPANLADQARPVVIAAARHTARSTAATAPQRKHSRSPRAELENTMAASIAPGSLPLGSRATDRLAPVVVSGSSGGFLPPHALMVVMETETYYGADGSVWTLWVWHVRAVEAVHNARPEGVPAKST